MVAGHKKLRKAEHQEVFTSDEQVMDQSNGGNPLLGDLILLFCSL